MGRDGAVRREVRRHQVRVVEIGGPWSRELCGGTHVGRSSQLGTVVVTGESSVGSGNRRVEALTGVEGFGYLAREHDLVAQLTGRSRPSPTTWSSGSATSSSGCAPPRRSSSRRASPSCSPPAAELAAGADEVGPRQRRRPTAPTARTAATYARWRSTSAAGCRRASPAWSSSSAPVDGTARSRSWPRPTTRRAPAGCSANDLVRAVGPLRRRQGRRQGRRRPGRRHRRLAHRRGAGGRAARSARAGAPRLRRMRPGVRLGIDPGDARIGVARSDPSGFLATPVETVRRGRGDLARIAQLASAEERGGRGRRRAAALAVRGRGAGRRQGRASSPAGLARRVAPVPVRLCDERLTTVSRGGYAARPGAQGAASGAPWSTRPRPC